MRLFLALTQRSFQHRLTYRSAALAGLATNLFFGLLRAAVMIALYENQPSVAGISIREAITYTAISQAVIAYLSLFGWYDLMHSVYTGEVATSLLKPAGLFTTWLALDSGRALAQLLLRGLPLILFYALIFDIAYPQGPGAWTNLVIALLLSGLVSFSFRFLVNLASFWTPNASGVGRFAFTLSWLFSGFLMPLDFFPAWFRQICDLTPFPSMIYTVVEAYLGLRQGAELFQALAVQAAWFLVLALAGQVVLRRGLRKLTIQGG